MLSCHQATFLVSKKQETKLTIRESIQLNVHLMMCDMCSLWKIQTDSLTEIIRKESGKLEDGAASLTEIQIQKLTDVIDQNNGK